MYRFKAGQVVSTPGALDALQANRMHPFTLLLRHLTGDWGNIPQEDEGLNEEALEKGYRLLSSYVLPDKQRVWIITEADRSATTLLLPEEY